MNATTSIDGQADILPCNTEYGSPSTPFKAKIMKTKDKGALKFYMSSRETRRITLTSS